MADEEMIQKGNLVMAAAREGRIGLIEDRLKRLQKSYLICEEPRTSSDQRKKIVKIVRVVYKFVLAVFVLFVAFQGIFPPIDGGPSGALVLFVILLAAPLVVFNYGQKKMEKESEEYVSLVNEWYPRLPRKNAA